MPFGPKRTVGISDHYSEVWRRSTRKLSEDTEASGKQWKTVEDKWKVWKRCRSEWKTGKGPGPEEVQKCPEEVGKVLGECRRPGKARECNTMLQQDTVEDT